MWQRYLLHFMETMKLNYFIHIHITRKKQRCTTGLWIFMSLVCSSSVCSHALMLSLAIHVYRSMAVTPNAKIQCPRSFHSTDLVAKVWLATKDCSTPTTVQKLKEFDNEMVVACSFVIVLWTNWPTFQLTVDSSAWTRSFILGASPHARETGVIRQPELEA